MLGELMESGDKILTDIFSVAMFGSEPAPEPEMENDDEFFMEFDGMENGQLSSVFAPRSNGIAHSGPSSPAAAPSAAAPAPAPAPSFGFGS